MVPNPENYRGKSALEIIEAATHLLRGKARALLPLYYIGSLPFILGFLFFWGDMSRNAYAAEHCAAASLGLAALFAWMKFWQALFMDNIHSLVSLEPPPSRTLAGLGRVVLVQTVVQPTGWIALPLALVMALPFAWVYAFYQHLSLAGRLKPVQISAAVKEAARQSRINPRQNHVLLFILTLLGLAVFINILIGLFALPYLLKTFFGVDTAFTLTWRSVVNTTYLAVSLGLTYLCLDPLIKTAYALRSFYGDSIKTGRDLSVQLKSLSTAGKAARTAATAALIMILVVMVSAGTVAAGQEADKPAAGSGISAAELEKSIEKVLARPEFSWRLPREKNTRETPGLFSPLVVFFNWIKPILGTALTPVVDFLKPIFQKILDWFRENFKTKPPTKESRDNDWIGWIKILLFLLLGVSGGMLGVYVKRLLERRKGTRPQTPDNPEPEIRPDLNEENINAAELKVEQWLALARELVGRGELRQALRAIYLATLAHLADQGAVSVARHKSNRDYVAELRRRRHDQQEALELFAAGVAFFDRAWYGLRALGRQDVEWFTTNHKRIVSLV